MLLIRFKYQITRIIEEGQDIVKLIMCPFIKLPFFRMKEYKREIIIEYEM